MFLTTLGAVVMNLDRNMFVFKLYVFLSLSRLRARAAEALRVVTRWWCVRGQLIWAGEDRPHRFIYSLCVASNEEF